MTYADIRRETATRMQAADRLACMWCGRDTPREMLAQYGARCRSCFDAYCADVPPRAPGPPEGVVPPGPKAWAHRLKWRHEHGERLSQTQIWMYQTCLKGDGTTGEPIDALR